jgi:hypothetical protein
VRRPTRPTTTVLAFGLLGACVLAEACAPTHAVRPLGCGNAALHASLGGPLVEVSGIDTPIPIVSLGGGYGLGDQLTATAELDATAAVFGVLHVQPGLAYHPLVRQGGALPTITLAGSVHLLTNFDDTRVAPQATLAAAWRIGRRHLVYLGGDSALAIGDPTRLVAGPFVGGEARLGRAWGLVLEAKWLAPNYDVHPLAPTWISPASHGYLSLLVGLTRYIGDVR